MRTLYAAGFALALFTGTALAQSAPAAAPAVPPNNGGPGAANPPGPADRGGWDRDGRGGAGDEQRWHHAMMHRSKAARFRLEAGDLRLAMKCPDDEPLKACQDFTMQILDKLGSMPQR